MNEESKSNGASTPAREGERSEPIAVPAPVATASKVRLTGPREGRQLSKKSGKTARQLTPSQKLLILDSWKKSGLPAGENTGGSVRRTRSPRASNGPREGDE